VIEVVRPSSSVCVCDTINPHILTYLLCPRTFIVKLWDIRSGVHVRDFFDAHTGSVTAIGMSPDGQFLASAGDDNDICIWDIPSGTLYAALSGHTDSIHSLDWDASSKVLASGSADSTVKIWDCSILHTYYTREVRRSYFFLRFPSHSR
jgi:WD40 repeat protein